MLRDHELHGRGGWLKFEDALPLTDLDDLPWNQTKPVSDRFGNNKSTGRIDGCIHGIESTIWLNGRGIETRSIGPDTNGLARCYVEDRQGAEAERQREGARRLIESGRPLMVCKTIVLELEWVLRGYYGFESAEVASVLRPLLGLPHVTIEDRATVEQALSHADARIDLADALHHASCRACASVAPFDDRRFARRAKRMGLSPPVMVPGARPRS